jgi:hypothetical protein
MILLIPETGERTILWKTFLKDKNFLYNQIPAKGRVMTYRISFVQKKEYLHARIDAESTVENVFDSLNEIKQTCLEQKYRKVLIEDNFTGPTISTLDIFTIINQIGPDVSPDIQKVAFVDVNRRHDPEALHFAETVAVNRGVNLRSFNDIKLAEEWLNQKIPGE